MNYQVTISAPFSVRPFDVKPTKVSDSLRAFGNEIVTAESVVFGTNTNFTLVAGPINYSLIATKVTKKDDKYQLELADGTKATFVEGRGLNITITELVDGEENDADEEEEDTPKKGKKSPAAKKGKKAAPVEDDEDDDADVSSDDEEDEEEEEEAPKSKKKAAKGKKVSLEEDEDDVSSDDEEEEEEEDAPKAKKKGAKASSKKGGKSFDWENEDD